jgi:hypothetical protein
LVALKEGKKPRGRPRKYNSEAEKHRAYRKRKKEKIALLEKKLAEIEKEEESDKQ